MLSSNRRTRTLTNSLLALALASCAMAPAYAGITASQATVTEASKPSTHNFHVEGAASACQPVSFADRNLLSLRWNGFALVNRGGVIAQSACSTDVYVRDSNGTKQVGLWVSNNDGGTTTQTVKCTLGYNTGGLGPKYITSYATIKPGSITQLTWTTDEFTPFAGQATIVCDLKPLTGTMRIFTIEGNAS